MGIPTSGAEMLSNLPANAAIRNILNRVNPNRGGGTDFTTQEDQLLESAAGQQIGEEREGESKLMQLLDYLARPQRAVAGVLVDMIDGDDFSPLDRIGAALGGSEAKGMKDFIDVVAPGKWSQVKLPEWMGGKDVDLTKEVVGFIGDVFTDPLMGVRPFHILNQVSKVGGVQTRTVHQWLKKYPKLADEFHAGQKQLESAAGIATIDAGALYGTRSMVAKTRYYWRKAMEEPEAFAKKWMTPEDALDFKQKYAGDFKKVWAKETVEKQFESGQRSLLGLKIPLAGKLLGLDNEMILKIPELDRQMGQMLARGTGKMFEGVFRTQKGFQAVNVYKNLFLHSSGNQTIDILMAEAGGLKGANEEVFKKLGRELQDAYGGLFDNETIKHVTDYLEHARDNFGRGELVPVKIAGYSPQKNARIQNIVDKHREILGLIREQELDTGILKTVIGKKFDQEQAYGAMLALTKDQKGAAFAKKYPTWKGLQTKVNEDLRKLTGGAYTEMDQANALKDLSEKYLDNAADFLHTTVPLRPTGYAPHIITEDGWKIFGNLLEHTGAMYGSQKALDAFSGFSKGRHIKNMSIQEFNQLIQDGDLPLDFLQKVFNQAKGNLKNRKGKRLMEHFLGSLDPESMHFWIEDPLQATYLRMVTSLRATSNKQAMDQLITTMGRTIPQAGIPRLGEIPYILSPEGMRVVHGDDWLTKLPKGQVDSYKALVKQQHLTADARIPDLFLESRNPMTLAAAHSTGVPVYGLPADVANEIHKSMKFARSSEQMSGFVKNFKDFTNWWKATTVAFFPGYHIRNIIGGFHLGFLGGSFGGADSLRNYTEATNFVRKSGIVGEDLRHAFGKNTLSKTSDTFESLAFVSKDGVAWSAEEQLKQMNHFGVLIKGSVRGEVPEAVLGELSTKQPSLLKKGLKQLTHHGTPVKTGFAVGNVFDNMHRVAMWRREVKAGMSSYDAAMKVKKYFPDFRTLTNFERNTISPLMMFYSWQRHNIPLQLEHIIRQPWKAAQVQRTIEFFQTDEAKQFDKKLLPKYVNEHFGVPIRVNKKTDAVETWMLQAWIPLADLVPIVSSDPGKTLTNQAISMANPLLKTPLELASNYSFFTRDKIEKYPGEPDKLFGYMTIDKKTKYLLKNIRGISEIDRFVSGKMTDEDQDLFTRFMKQSGLVPRGKAFDIESLKKRFKLDANKRKGELKRSINKAKKRGDKDMEQYLTDLFEDADARAKANS